LAQKILKIKNKNKNKNKNKKTYQHWGTLARTLPTTMKKFE
jgi:hypothetical protein